jgi:redox-sensitive bicupin YhaK (pirin superfamily)
VSPSDIGQLIKPFVFLDYGEVPPSDTMSGIHPHSGIATLTVAISGALAYEDTTGKSGKVVAGGLEWMKAGGGVWHDGHALGPEWLKVYQLWVALPASEENAPAESSTSRRRKSNAKVRHEYCSVSSGMPRVRFVLRRASTTCT